MGVQQYCLYRWRFITDGSIWAAFAPFGGDSGQLTNLAMVLRLILTENPW